MEKLRKIRLLGLLLCTVAAVSSHAQDANEPAEPTAPQPNQLEANWWSYFEGTGENLDSRIDGFLGAINTQISELQTANEADGQSIVAAIRENFSAYQALLNENEPEVVELPAENLIYSIDDLLSLAAVSRNALDDAKAEQLEVERERRILDGASRRRDLAFKNYVDAGDGDERLLAALRLIQARLAQAIAERRLQLLSQRHERTTAYAEGLTAHIVLASESLATTTDEAGLDKLNERVVATEALVTDAQESLRSAELAAIGLDLDTPEGRSHYRLQQQQQLDAAVGLALAEVALAQAQARRWWTELKLGTAPDPGIVQEQALAWSELLRRVELSTTDWQRDTQDELLAVQSIDRDGLERSSQRLLDQRLGTAQGTLTRIGELSRNIADLEILTMAVDNAVAEYSGAFRSWLSSLSRQVKTLYMRVIGTADVTLFSIGETPVTGRDILRVLIILIVAYLLSRGIRHAIRRFSDSESSGTQASLYTVGRLTHYTIIIFAVFIALSSIGLNFGNLALVAGALSVGIGFGLQSIVNNFVSGLIILFEHTLRVGDYVELDTGLTGTVKAINVRSTLINTNDNIDIVVPNSEFVTTRLTNWTLGERVLRVRIPFGVAYGSDKELVRKAALEAVDEVPFTLSRKGREPDVWLVDFGESSLDFLLLVWVNRQGARRPTRTRATYLWALESKLAEHGIEIPFPQRDLHVRSGWPSKK